MERYETELNEKVNMLKDLLKNYDDWRRKSFYCVAVNLLDLQDVKFVMEQAINDITPETPLKMKATTVVRLFGEMAEIRGVSLELRKAVKL